ADPTAEAVTGAYDTEDPAFDDGLFILHTTATGSTDVTASMHLYADTTLAVEVVEGSAVAADFVLPSGLLDVGTSPLEGSVGPGESTTVEVEITNVSDVPVAYQLGVRDPSFEVASADVDGAGAEVEYEAEGTWSLEASQDLSSGTMWT